MLARISRISGTVAVLGALLAPIGFARVSQDEASQHMRQGMALIQQEGQAQKALEEFQKAIELSPELAGAHFYAGMALGQLQRFDESMEEFLKAADLDPGNAQTYVMACRTAYALKNYEESWNQAILAAQAGQDMSQAFAGLEQVSPRPDDFDTRMSAPRVLVPQLDLSRVGAADATPDNTTGSTMDIASRTEEFREVRRQLALSLIRSEVFSVTQTQGQATYILAVEIDTLEAANFSGLMKLIDTESGDTAMSRPVSFPNSISGIRSATDRLAGFLEEWLASQ